MNTYTYPPSSKRRNQALLRRRPLRTLSAEYFPTQLAKRATSSTMPSCSSASCLTTPARPSRATSIANSYR
ncbi:GAT domain-containing protein [Histoplasma capsulatum G186AR]|uniref:GAT domain-containing protein n=1 Tax=Ajellomyces capsulatus TaxID=5037 RepID=A0A8H7YWZ7_AJECA|nr:GAT domain-containing protein [Histoplasma capsulatum]QSS73231.1 GAT domain-containing protein [Histoplasma capsulatum G186AR]